jgi:hypothetical protein
VDGLPEFKVMVKHLVKAKPEVIPLVILKE